MAFEQRDNSGTLFVNDKKQQQSQPDMKGQIMVDGVMYWVSAWSKEGKNGKFISLSVQKKDASYINNKIINEANDVFSSGKGEEVPF